MAGGWIEEGRRTAGEQLEHDWRMAEGWLEGEGLVEDGWKFAVGWPECREQSCSFVPEEGGVGTRVSNQLHQQSEEEINRIDCFVW